MHITASVINDDERGLHQDLGVRLEKLAPHELVAGIFTIVEAFIDVTSHKMF